jgi:DNA-binding NarL/FixJ family response regulator
MGNFVFVDAASGVHVLVVEPNEVARRGLHEMLRSLSTENGGTVAEVRSVKSSEDAITVLAEHRPELLIMPSDLGGTAVQCVVEDAGEAAVLILVRSAEPGHLASACNAHASGFLLEQNLTIEALARAIDQVLRGEMPIPAELARHLLRDVATRSTSERAPLLTPREEQVLGLLAEGLSNKQIARTLGISAHGAKRHVANVLMKMNCPNRTLAVARAINEGLVHQAV